MKTITTAITLVLLLLTCPGAMAQDFMDALKQVAEAHNEAHGEGNSEEGPSLSDEEKKQLENYWKEKTKDAGDFISALDEPYHQCLALIGLYNYHLKELVIAKEEAQNCKLKYDYLGLTSLMLIGGTTLMPCTEELFNLDWLERRRIVLSFFKALFSCKDGPGFVTEYEWTPLAAKAPKVVAQIVSGYEKPGCQSDWYDEYGPSNAGIIDKILAEVFEPKALVTHLVKIGQEMEALGCSG
ncbi:hypothetical protein ACA086_14460 [Muriicola sp. E247]|uniref:hypothetical protein n=1 Tax=Muriicola sp. E247 TaxID=3242730 RepID=UPI0035264875